MISRVPPTALETASTSPPPSAPSGLAKAGRALWQQVTRRYALRIDELRILEEAARTADELATINAALVGAPAMVPGPRGRQQPNPLLAEARRHRAIYFRALAALGLGGAEDVRDGDTRERSSAGRALAKQRWVGRSG